jgi:hypothetical protein
MKFGKNEKTGFGHTAADYMMSEAACRSFIIWSTFALISFLCVQLFFDISWQNIVCSVMSTACSLFVIWLVVRPRYFFGASISVFVLLINTFINFIFPIFFTLIEGRSLVYRLQKPVDTFY